MRNIDPQQFTILNERLSILLGFSDGVDDVLDNLLTIESRADLLDYLVQLLGSDRHDALRDFVDDVDRVRAGATLNVAKSSPEVKSTSEVKTVEMIEKKKSDKVSPVKAPPVPKSNNTKSKTNGMVQKQKQQKSYASVIPKKPVVKGYDQRPKASQQAQRSGQRESSQASTLVKDEKQDQQQQEVLPLQGKAKVVCGCFGTMHKALNNCLHCGRISCEREGYDYCPFCSFMVHEDRSNPMSQSNDYAMTNNEAWEQKERLLQYDREFAQRTIILDDQADYYNKATSNWLNEQEQEVAQKQEQERSNAIQKRPATKMVLDI